MVSFFPPWLQRAFVSLLCLVASLAYVTREEQSAYLSELFPMAQMQPLEACGTHRHKSPSAPHHDHSGHCPFCFAAALALAAGFGVLLLAPELVACWLAWKPRVLWLQRLRRFSARAPPAECVSPSPRVFYCQATCF